MPRVLNKEFTDFYNRVIVSGTNEIFFMLKMWKLTKSCQFQKINLYGFSRQVFELLKGLEDRYYQKFGDSDRGRLKMSKFKSKLGSVLSCDFWPKSGCHPTLKVC